MINRKQKKNSFHLPIIKNRHKYNQQNSHKGQQQFSVSKLNKSIASTYSHYPIEDYFAQYKPNKAIINVNNYTTMRKVLKSVQKQIVHLTPNKGNKSNQHRKIQYKTICLANKIVNTKQKPPHRYKTTMLIFKNCLFLYGGLGCQKNLTWAKLNFQNMNWEMAKTISGIKPINTYFPCSPIYGHTMVRFQELAIVFGGSCIDQINQTTIINTKTMTITQGSRSPFRRKEHAAVVLNNLMIVHGGIQAKQVKNQIFLYNITNDKWINLSNCGLPALSSHKLCQGKSNKQLYMFGGLNSKYKLTNKLYRIKQIIIQTSQVRWQQIECENSPHPRHSFCFQKLSNNLLLLYGGRQDNQTTNESDGIENGVFNDIHTYNIQKRIWQRVLINSGFQYCFGMASTSINGTVFIYGGSNHSLYADASINLIWNSSERNDPWQSAQGSQLEIHSSKKISCKMILV